jgi:hypothetical protein
MIKVVRERFEERRDRLYGKVPEWYRPVLDDHDAETGFVLGSYHLMHPGWVHAGFARA